MAKAVPLPRPDTLPEGVLLHRDAPGEPRFVLQVPNAGMDSAETYVVDLEDPMHEAWFGALKNHVELKDTLNVEMHVAYCPRTGHVQPLKDLDEVSPAALMYAQARALGTQTRTTPVDSYFAQKRMREKHAQTAARAQGFTGPVSALRQLLGGR